MKSLLIIANNNLGTGQSGGDTIFINMIKHWQGLLKITVLGSQETRTLLKQHLKIQKYKFIISDNTSPFTDLSVFSLIFHNLRRIFFGFKSIFLNLNLHSDFVYTASDFYPDLLPGLFYKLINPHTKFIAGFYLIIPPPADPASPYSHQIAKGTIFYLLQRLSLFMVNIFADYIFITSHPDKKNFPKFKDNIFIIQGGVDSSIPANYFKIHPPLPIDSRRYDAVFQGRLHPQKGILEFIDIWSLVVQKIPQARLAIIGDGQLEDQLISKIKTQKLSENIELLGFVSGSKKYRIFRDSKIVVHPAVFDSGGMSAAEAMAWGLPGVSYDLEALKTYYPQGMIKTPCFDQSKFAANIIKLLKNRNYYQSISDEALALINTKWNWSTRLDPVYKNIFT